MTSPFRALCLPFVPCALTAILLSACGGGGGAEDSAIGPAVPSASACLPTRAGYDQVSISMDSAETPAAMGCQGAVLNVVTVEGVAETTYHWGAAGTGAYAQVKVRSGRVVGKIAQRLDGASALSLCLPTAPAYEALPNGSSVSTAAATFGCSGALVSEMSVEGLTQLSYAWGSVASGPYALVNFGNGVMTGRLGENLNSAAAPSSCVPTRTAYDSVTVGLSLAAVRQRIGCEGQMLAEFQVSGLSRQTYAWGDVATGPYAQIVFDGGLVTGKVGQRLDAGTPANCTPTQSRFDALASGSSLAAVQAVMGCAGELVNEVTVGGIRQVNQAWGQVASGPYVMVTLRADQMSARLGQRLDGTGSPSICAPTAANHAALTVGMTVAQATAVMGCAGQLLNEVVTGDTNEKTFTWGNVTGPYQQVKFRNGALAAKIGMML
jgi:hypothetical protein